MKLYTPYNILTKKFPTMSLSPTWQDFLGKPSPHGSWFIYGKTKQGKTTFTMLLCRELIRHYRVLYYGLEEGLSLSYQNTMHRCGIKEKTKGFQLGAYDPKTNEKDEPTVTPLQDLKEELKKNKYQVVVIDTIQKSEINVRQYKNLLLLKPERLFIFVSHVIGTQPQGKAAFTCEQLSQIKVYVENFRAHNVGRFQKALTLDFVPQNDEALRYFGAPADLQLNYD
jgi:hypothetical protein